MQPIEQHESPSGFPAMPINSRRSKGFQFEYLREIGTSTRSAILAAAIAVLSLLPGVSMITRSAPLAVAASMLASTSYGCWQYGGVFRLAAVFPVCGIGLRIKVEQGDGFASLGSNGGNSNG